ncbi:unnamed protein product [Lymnaea stagnalis]|uniref:von Willebrand factor A domain-containing protein 3B n=1 Tax=Lymnaea stagnalis TaxID=6523 RepID=A0AAV2I4L2_LYMST
MTALTSKLTSYDINYSYSSSSNVKFDISHKTALHSTKCSKQNEAKDIINLKDLQMKPQRPKEWELDVRSLISSRKWLQNYGLKKNRLQLNQILPSIGFKISDEFDEALKKPVSSRYCEGQFSQLLRPDGRTFNVNCSKDKLLQLEKRLLQSVNLFRRRLEWLTTESRRIFGVIEERSITIVLDIQNMDPELFDQYRVALERVIREQVSQIAKFNLIRACEDITSFSPECVPVSHDTVENAIEWMWSLDRMVKVANSSVAEAVLRAFEDNHIEAVYLYTEGTSVECGKEILKQKVSNAQRKAPVHVVSFNCDSSNTISFLKDFVKMASGRFHAYGLIMELDVYETQPMEGQTNRANTILRRKTIGGIPPGAGVREDVIFIFEELEEARSNLTQIRMLIDKVPEPGRSSAGNIFQSFYFYEPPKTKRSLSSKDEQYMSSKEWLDVYGLEVRKLGLYDILSTVAFKHQDGIMDSMHPPNTETQTDAVISQKLVNARYCEKFPVVKWRDGQTVHVQVTPDVHRSYEEKVQVALNKIQQRIDWLNKGSRSLFGTLVEDQIYILIDTSDSMRPSLGFVKQKILVLMQEQLRHKKKFNFVAFNSKAAVWKDRLVEVSESSLRSAWSWIENLSCWGSTNTYAAIQIAMADPNTQAIYLLTDGRPDQPPKSILAQVQMQKSIPIHCISFNCDDVEANQFLYSLSEATGGRYHYFSETGPPVEHPKSWQSMDVQLLKDEIKRGLENLDQLTDLRDECTRLAWKRETDSLRQSINSSRKSTEGSYISAVPPLDPKDLYRPETPLRSSRINLTHRPSSAPPTISTGFSLSQHYTPSPPIKHPHSARDDRGYESARLSVRSPRKLKSGKLTLSKKPLYAAHTRTSLLRTLSSSGRFSPSEWLLPETKTLFQQQAERQRQIAHQNEVIEEQRKKKVKVLAKANEKSSKQWLSKHGLIAKKLTILDALGPTFVPLNPKYVTILDKYVMSKVFNEILPLAHVSRNHQIRLINPAGVNLDEYEKKVQVAVGKYRKRLNKIVWSALPNSAKEEFNNSDQPVSFEENKEKLLKYLEEDDYWPIREKDVNLLLKEIAYGEKYMAQSVAIRKAAAGEDEEDDKDSFDLVPKRSRSPDTSNHAVSSPREKSDHSSRSSKNKEKDLDSTSHSVEDIQQANENTESRRKKITMTLTPFKGQRVIARQDKDGLYYPAVVKKAPDLRHAVVEYEDKVTATVFTRYVIPVGGAVARAALYGGDYVLIRVVNLENESECYVPAKILKSDHTCLACKCYTVVMYNGQIASTSRKHLVKISKERFDLAFNFLTRQEGENKEEAEEIIYIKKQWKNKEKKPEKSPAPPPADPRSPAPPPADLRSPSSSPSRSRSTSRSRSNSRSGSSSRSRSSSRSSSSHRSSPSPRPKSSARSRTISRSPSIPKSRSIPRSRSTSVSSAESKRSTKPEKLRQEMITSFVLMGKERGEEETLYRSEPKPNFLLKLRRDLPPIKETEVDALARWLDDGWYYRCHIIRCYSDQSYDMKDSTGLVERIWREDIISDEDDYNKDFKEGDTVVALHPKYSFSYAPGVISELKHDEFVEVRFYDGQTAELSLQEGKVYHISTRKYKLDVEFIEKKEKEWIGSAVIARDDKTGAYFPGTVRKKINSQMYSIEWANGSSSHQSVIHIFGAFTRQPKLSRGDKILACVDPHQVKYLPGVLNDYKDGKLVVKFCNEEVRDDIEEGPWYYLSQVYYEDAMNYYKNKNNMKKY